MANQTKPDCASTRKRMIDALKKSDSKYRKNLDTKNLKSIMHLNSGIYHEDSMKEWHKGMLRYPTITTKSEKAEKDKRTKT